MASITSALLHAAGQPDRILDCARRLIAAQSPNPPGDTHAAAAVAADLVRALVPNAELTLYRASETIGNLVAVVRGTRPGSPTGSPMARRLVLSGHLDTYPLGDASGWTVPSFAGEIRDGKLYGRGAADMKGGIAASIIALAALAAHPDTWRGEAVLALAGDEESMGTLGTQFLLENVPLVRGDAVIIGDAGSPLVLRFGEKGFLWVRLTASGKPAHGAHVHLGVNALDRLRAALDDISGLRALRAAPPPGVAEAIAAAKPISEPLGGPGEAAVLGSVTVNLGRIEGEIVPQPRAGDGRGGGTGPTPARRRVSGSGRDRPGHRARPSPRRNIRGAAAFRPDRHRSGRRDRANRPPRGTARPRAPAGDQHACRRVGRTAVPPCWHPNRGLRPDAIQHGRRRRIRAARRSAGRCASARARHVRVPDCLISRARNDDSPAAGRATSLSLREAKRRGNLPPGKADVLAGREIALMSFVNPSTQTFLSPDQPSGGDDVADDRARAGAKR